MRKVLKALLCLVVVLGMTLLIPNESIADESSLRFSYNTLWALRDTEKGPIYLPYDDYDGTIHTFGVTVNKDENPDTLSVTWISGESSLKNLYYLEQDSGGGWWMRYNAVYGGTGTATFRLTAGLNGETVEENFTVKVTEIPEKSRPVLKKETIHVAVGEAVILADHDILDNIDNCIIVSYQGEVYSWGGVSSEHESEDVDGYRYTLQDGTFTAKEDGKYPIHIWVEPSRNMAKFFTMTIVAGNPSTPEDPESGEEDTSVELKKLSLKEGKKKTMKVGEKLTLTPVLSPESATPKLTWKSSDKKIVKVSSKGVITALKKGTATITVKSDNGKKAEIKITVKEGKAASPTKITLAEGKKKTMKVGEKLTLTPKLTPSSATAKLTWTSSNKKIVKVSSKGKITALKKGKATITVKTDNGKKFEIKITVKAK